MSDFSAEERSWMLGKFYAQIVEYFAHWEDASISRDDLDEVYRQYVHEGLSATTRSEFVGVVMQWVGRLKNGHTWCYDTESDGSGSHLGYQLDRMGDDWVVVRSMVDEVRPGDVIERIDGYTPSEWMAKMEPVVNVRQPRVREAYWQYCMPLFWNSSKALLLIRSKDDKVREVTYTPTRVRTIPQKHTEGRWLKEGSIGYIQIPSFSQPHYEEEAITYVRQFASAQTLVFDIRSNDGGSTPSSLSKAVMDRPYRWWTETSPNIGHLRRRHGESKQFTFLPDGSGARCVSNYEESTECLFTGKVIVLTGRYAGSAAEDFIMPLKDTGRGILVGEHTWGSTGQPMVFEYKGVSFGVGSVRAYIPDGTPFEGIGITPDVSVERTREDLYQGRDPVLERALELAE